MDFLVPRTTLQSRVHAYLWTAGTLDDAYDRMDSAAAGRDCMLDQDKVPRVLRPLRGLLLSFFFVFSWSLTTDCSFHFLSCFRVLSRSFSRSFVLEKENTDYKELL